MPSHRVLRQHATGAVGNYLARTLGATTGLGDAQEIHHAGTLLQARLQLADEGLRHLGSPRQFHLRPAFRDAELPKPQLDSMFENDHNDIFLAWRKDMTNREGNRLPEIAVLDGTFTLFV